MTPSVKFLPGLKERFLHGWHTSSIAARQIFNDIQSSLRGFSFLIWGGQWRGGVILNVIFFFSTYSRDLDIGCRGVRESSWYPLFNCGKVFSATWGNVPWLYFGSGFQCFHLSKLHQSPTHLILRFLKRVCQQSNRSPLGAVRVIGPLFLAFWARYQEGTSRWWRGAVWRVTVIIGQTCLMLDRSRESLVDSTLLDHLHARICANRQGIVCETL